MIVDCGGLAFMMCVMSDDVWAPFVVAFERRGEVGGVTTAISWSSLV